MKGLLVDSNFILDIFLALHPKGVKKSQGKIGLSELSETHEIICVPFLTSLTKKNKLLQDT